MVDEWILTGWRDAAMVVVSTLVIFVVTITLTRLNGLRSFARMSAFDFATTVAMGTLLASTLATSDLPLLQGIVGLATLFTVQQLVARGRRLSSRFQDAVDNEPILLMRDGEFLVEQMQRARVTHDDLRGQLRAANVLSLAHVRAVVLESTGDVSVLHSPRDAEGVDDEILAHVRGFSAGAR